MKINRTWAMPSKDTFSIKPVNELISRYITKDSVVCDPFVGKSPFREICRFINDLDPSLTNQGKDALLFLEGIPSESCNMVLFDPPYSPRQVSECYKKFDKTVNMETTQSSYWSKLKKEIARITRQESIVITCGWNSGGIGKGLGFKIIEILLVAHGGWHNDTIVTVEVKNEQP